MHKRKTIAGIFLLFILILFSSSAFSQNISISLRRVTLEKAFREIEKKTDHRFVYTKEMAEQGNPVTVDVKNVPLQKLLNQIFARQPLEFRLDNNFITIRFKPSPTPPVSTASIKRDVQGRILNESKEPITGASVQVKGSAIANATDDKGWFLLKGIDENAILLISSIGYLKKEISLNGRSSIEVMLSVFITSLDETVVIAYGTTTKRLNTGSVSKVHGEQIEKQPVSNPIAALAGRVPGLFITQSNGLPGSAFKVQIRGQNSLQQGNEPLYIVDGVPFISDALVQRSGLSANNPLNTLNPADVESIEILKDADATAIYGSRGANGVILITTKKAAYGKARLDISSYTGFGKASRLMSLMNTQEYLMMRREAFLNDGVTPSASNAYDLLSWDTTRYTNWQKLLVGGTAHSTNTDIRFSAGTVNTRFSFGANYYKENTVFPGDNSGERIAFNLNSLHTSSDNKFNASITANYGSDKNDLPRQDLTSFILLPPNTPVLYDSLGKLNWREKGFSFDNPLAKLEQTYKGVTDMLTTNASISYRFLPWLKIKSLFGYNTIQLNELSTFPVSSQDPQLLPTGSSSIANNQVKSWIIEPQAEASTSIGKKGKLNVLIGITMHDKRNRSTILDGSGFTNDYLIEAVASAPVIKTKNDLIHYKYRAIYGRLNYNWDTKYLLNLTGRRDGSSRFGPGNQFANFGAIGAGWIFSKETFINNKFKFLSFGKLRSSIGTTGNDQIGNYQYLDSWSSSLYPYQGQSSLEPTRLFNADYSWELTRKWEMAMETGFFDNKILFNINYYLSRTENQIVYYPVPTQTGFSNILKNFPGVVQNKGWEFEVNTYNIRRPLFTWTSSLNLTLPKNMLLKFPGLENTTYANSYRIGEPINVRLGYRFLGVDPMTGLYKLEDIDKDGRMDAKDYVVLGNTNPQYYGGFQNSFFYKGWELSFLMQFVNQKGLNPTYRSNNAGGISNQSIHVLERWKNSGDNALYQKYSQGTGAASTAAFLIADSDATLTDASYIRLKTASLTYSLPQTFAKKLKMEYCRFFVRGQNLFVITNYVGSDPESQTLTALPPLRMIASGLQLSF
ncbi:MAG: SusC/RagA family TonB-linked outer membrane protein [Chitinophagaceae bacterium]